jgi:hypothetical protein
MTREFPLSADVMVASFSWSFVFMERKVLCSEWWVGVVLCWLSLLICHKSRNSRDGLLERSKMFFSICLMYSVMEIFEIKMLSGV